MSDVDVSPLASSAYLVLDVIIVTFRRAGVSAILYVGRRLHAYQGFRLTE